MSVKQRTDFLFWRQVDKSASGGCWLWAGRKMPSGYGQFGKYSTRAHRHALVLSGIKIPAGKVVMHLCDNRLCVNPAHLRIGTAKENSEDMSRKGRARGQDMTHCLRGHKFTPENTRFAKGKVARRVCRTCDRDAARRRYQERAEIQREMKERGL